MKKKLVIYRHGVIRVDFIEMIKSLQDYYDVLLVSERRIDQKDYFSDKTITQTGINFKRILFKNGILGGRIAQIVATIKGAKTIQAANPDIVLVSAINTIFLFRFFRFWSKCVLLGAHASVGKRNIKNLMWDVSGYINHHIFKNQIISNRSVIYKYKPENKNIGYVNSCVSQRSNTDKAFDTMKFIYIGSLDQRRVEDTIIAYYRFYQEYKNQVEMSYTIIGSGENTAKQIRSMIKDNDCGGTLQYLGSLDDKSMNIKLDGANIGIGFIPVTDYYKDNFSFKVLEFLLSGMPVIATKLNTNLDIINNINGVLIEDTVEGIYEGMIEIRKRLNDFSSSEIRKTAEQFSVAWVVKNQYIPFLESL